MKLDWKAEHIQGWAERSEAIAASPRLGLLLGEDVRGGRVAFYRTNTAMQLVARGQATVAGTDDASTESRCATAAHGLFFECSFSRQTFA